MTSSDANTGRVCVVIVTYGDRYHYIAKVIDASLRNEVGKIVLVAGKVTPASLSLLKAKASAERKLELIIRSDNQGSAAGFGIGITRALSDNNSDFIWLLDDDNAPRDDALGVLMNGWDKLKRKYPTNKVALMCFRPDHQVDLATGLPPHRCYSRNGCFFGYHIFNMPYRFWRLTPWGPRKPDVYPEFIRMPYGPYGGFFAHRSVYQEIGFPMAKLILYEDDLEYTLRLTEKGGMIFLCPYARIDSLEDSWGSLSRYWSGLNAWLNSPDDFRIFYAARNMAFFEKVHYGKKLLRFINRTVFLSILRFAAVMTRRQPRFELIREAIRLGESGKLGIDSRFPLP